MKQEQNKPSGLQRLLLNEQITFCCVFTHAMRIFSQVLVKPYFLVSGVSVHNHCRLHLRLNKIIPGRI